MPGLIRSRRPRPGPKAGPAKRSGPKPVDVAAGVICRGEELLITQRLPGTHLGGLWEFPGGKRAPAESWKASLKRELREELGIEVQVGPFLHSVIHRYPEKTVRIRFYHCVWQKHEPQSFASQCFHWVRPRDLGRFAFPEADQKLLR